MAKILVEIASRETVIPNSKSLAMYYFDTDSLKFGTYHWYYSDTITYWRRLDHKDGPGFTGKPLAFDFQKHQNGDIWKMEELFDHLEANVVNINNTAFEGLGFEPYYLIPPATPVFEICSKDGLLGLPDVGEFIYSNDHANEPINWIAIAASGFYPLVESSTDVRFAICGLCLNDLTINNINVETVVTDYRLTVSANSSDGSLEYSIDTINWQTDNVFTVPIPVSNNSQYTISVRDNRGCKTVTEDIILSPSQLFGVRFRTEFVENDNGSTYRFDIEKKGYSGPIEVVQAGGNPVTMTIGSQGGEKYLSIRGSEAKLNVISKTNEQFSELFSGKDREFKGVIYKDNEIYWIGFIATEQYSERYTTTPYNVQISFLDGLGRLKNNDYLPDLEIDYTNLTALSHIAICLQQTGIDINILTNCQLFASDGTTILANRALESYEISTQSFINGDTSMTCYEVLDELLKTQKAKIYQEGGKWIVVDRDISDNYSLVEYNSRGVEINLVPEDERCFDVVTHFIPYNPDANTSHSTGVLSGLPTPSFNTSPLCGTEAGSFTLSGLFSSDETKIVDITIDTTLQANTLYEAEVFIYFESTGSISSEFKTISQFELRPKNTTADSLIAFRIIDSNLDGNWHRISVVFDSLLITTAEFELYFVFDTGQVPINGGGGMLFDSFSINKVVSPQVSITRPNVSEERVLLNNYNLTFKPAYKKFNLTQMLVERKGLIRNGDFELSGNGKPHRNWRNDNGIGSSVSIPSDNKTKPALFIPGDGRDNSSQFKYSTEEYQVYSSGSSANLRLKIKFRVVYRGSSTTVRFRLGVTPFYLDNDGAWVNTETFIEKIINDGEDHEIEINTAPLSQSGILFFDIYEAFTVGVGAIHGGLYVEEVSLTMATVGEKVEATRTLTLENDEDFVHKPVEYKMRFGDNNLFQNSTLLFTNTILQPKSNGKVVEEWRYKTEEDVFANDATLMTTLISRSIFNNYLNPTKILRGTVRGDLLFSNIVLEDNQFFQINSDTFNLLSNEHNVELLEVGGTGVFESFERLTQDGKERITQDNNIRLLENG